MMDSKDTRTPRQRRTKIVATLGPATDEVEVLEELIRAGADVLRINFSHGLADEQRERVATVRETARRVGRNVAIMGDLQGPKIRIESFTDGFVSLAKGQTFTLDTEMDPESGTAEAVGVAYRKLVQDVKAGDVLLLDDGQGGDNLDPGDTQPVVQPVPKGLAHFIEHVQAAMVDDNVEEVAHRVGKLQPARQLRDDGLFFGNGNGGGTQNVLELRVLPDETGKALDLGKHGLGLKAGGWLGDHLP